MKSLFDTKISYYRNVEDNVGTEISLRDFLFCDKYKEQIEHIRSISDEDVQKRLKLQLPVATISGTFAPTCKAENLVAHSNLLCIDIDKKDNLDVDWFDDMKHEWHNIPQILYAGRSIRGKGWFAIFRIAYPDKHEAQFEALKRDFANSGLIIDKACKNVNRMRFISYDPEHVCDYITHTLGRGATVWQAQGAYTHAEHHVVLTVLTRGQAVLLRRYLKKIDPHAFLIVANSSEIFGKGFLQP